MDPRRILVIVVAALVAVLTLGGCASASDRSIGAVASVTYSQRFAVPDFDEGEYVMEGEDLLPLLDLMRTYDIDPATYTGGGAPCPDAITTDLTISFDDGTPDNSVSMTGCMPETFAVDAGVLLINYTSEALTRENGYGSVAFSQYPPGPGMDEYEHAQDIPEEIARFVALLEEYDIEPDGYHSTPAPGCTGGVRTAVSLFNTSDLEPHVIARMELDDCGARTGFDAEATAMITGWREALS